MQGVSPTSKQIADGTSLFSLTTVCHYLKTMQEKGIFNYGGVRNITTTRQKKIHDSSSHVPVLGSVSCGVPKFAEENIEEYISLPISLFGKGD